MAWALHLPTQILLRSEQVVQNLPTGIELCPSTDDTQSHERAAARSSGRGEGGPTHSRVQRPLPLALNINPPQCSHHRLRGVE